MSGRFTWGVGTEARSHDFRTVIELADGVPVALLTSCGCGWLGGCSATTQEAQDQAYRQWVRHVAEAVGHPGVH